MRGFELQPRLEKIERVAHEGCKGTGGGADGGKRGERDIDRLEAALLMLLRRGARQRRRSDLLGFGFGLGPAG